MNPTANPERTWEFLLMMMYVRQLEKSFRKGLYKQYTTFEYNDSKVKGRIDIARHIKLNPIFNGNVAYLTRENTIVNDYNRLFLLTYDLLMKKYPTAFRNLLYNNRDLKKKIDFIRNELSTFIQPDQKTILKNSSKPIVRHMYLEYEQLRKISILILKRMGINVFNSGSKDVYGVLIDITKLWEKFLENTFKEHCNGINIKSQESFPLFKNSDRKIRPDFILSKRNNANYCVLDAKYKAGWEKGIDNEENRNDIYQVLAYMYRLNLNFGGIVHPTQDNSKKKELYCIDSNQNNHFYTIPIVIPKGNNSYDEFKSRFKKNIDTTQSLDK